jgi:hypothetical protein
VSNRQLAAPVSNRALETPARSFQRRKTLQLAASCKSLWKYLKIKVLRRISLSASSDFSKSRQIVLHDPILDLLLEGMPMSGVIAQGLVYKVDSFLDARHLATRSDRHRVCCKMFQHQFLTVRVEREDVPHSCFFRFVGPEAFARALS